MERKPISGPEDGDLRIIKEGPLKIFQRGSILYIRGTITVRGQSVRVRQSTGLLACPKDNWETAREIVRKIISEVQDSIIHGVTPSPAFGLICDKYIKTWETLKQTDADTITELLLGYPLPFRLKKGQRQTAPPLAEVDLSSLTKSRIDAWYTARFPNHAATTIRRHQNTLGSIFKYAREILGYDAPYFTKKKVKTKLGKHMDKRFEPGEIEKLVEFAAPHLKPILATLFVTGARVAMTLYLNKDNFLIVRNGRDKIFFPNSKNGNAYERALHDYAAEILDDWLVSRSDNYKAMFLTHRGKPYAPLNGAGGQIKFSFNTARNRLVDYLIEQGQEDRAEVIRQITPHWARHNFAIALRASGADPKEIAEAGMWESMDVVIKHYISDRPERVAKRVRGLDFGTHPTQSQKKKKID